MSSSFKFQAGIVIALALCACRTTSTGSGTKDISSDNLPPPPPSQIDPDSKAELSPYFIDKLKSFGWVEGKNCVLVIDRYEASSSPDTRWDKFVDIEVFGTPCPTPGSTIPKPIFSFISINGKLQAHELVAGRAVDIGTEDTSGISFCVDDATNACKIHIDSQGAIDKIDMLVK